ncbi:Peroxisome biogenesis protein 12 [Vitis vinifera]|uniref:Peroxisome biogenesis protein 12 n=1 Tax=Vitis vinifera TaxID=29760 RepID=A0A438FKV2_VITVI|nr:Peroxisome biogenesis protein 12 [Vitis vinifera]
MVVLPYFKSKLHSVYNKEREATLQASLWGHGDERFDDADYFSEERGSLIPTRASDVEVSVRARLTKRFQKFIGIFYPWLHAGNEDFCCAGLSFAYQLLYLLDATGFYSLGLHALGIHVCRATGQELVYIFHEFSFF